MTKAQVAVALLGIAVVSILVIQNGAFAKPGTVDQTTGTPMENAQKIIQDVQQSVAPSQTSPEGTGVVIPVPPIRPRIDILEGVAFDRYSMSSQDVLLLRIGTNGNERLYLLIGDEVNKMKLVDTTRKDNVWFAKLTTDKGEEVLFTVVENGGNIFVSGTFRNYLISFNPYPFNYPVPYQPPCKYIYLPPYREPIQQCEPPVSITESGAPLFG